MHPPNSGLELAGHERTELAELVLDSLASAIAVIDREGQILATNSSWQQWAQSPVDGLAGLAVGQNFLDACRDQGTADSAVGDHIADGTIRVITGRAPCFEIQFEVPHADKDKWFLLVVTHLHDVGAVVTRADTTPHHDVQAALAGLAFHDPLTGLPNRWLVLDRLRLAVDRSVRRGTWTTVVFADLDGFKAINDTLGHGSGDQVLTAVGHRLCSALRVEDTCGRWGGDEFVMVLELQDPAVIGDIVRRLETEFVLPFLAGDTSVRVRVSLGVAMAQSHLSGEDLLKLADDAMYRAKRHGHVVVFTAAADGTSVRTVS